MTLRVFLATSASKTNLYLVFTVKSTREACFSRALGPTLKEGLCSVSTGSEDGGIVLSCQV